MVRSQKTTQWRNITPSEIRTISDTWTNLNFDDIEKRLPQLENWNPIPAFSLPNDKDFVKVAKTDEIQSSHMKEVNLANEPICIANVD